MNDYINKYNFYLCPNTKIAARVNLDRNSRMPLTGYILKKMILDEDGYRITIDLDPSFFQNQGHRLLVRIGICQDFESSKQVKRNLRLSDLCQWCQKRAMRNIKIIMEQPHFSFLLTIPKVSKQGSCTATTQRNSHIIYYRYQKVSRYYSSSCLANSSTSLFCRSPGISS